jgi:hypothetical protein
MKKGGHRVNECMEADISKMAGEYFKGVWKGIDKTARGAFGHQVFSQKMSQGKPIASTQASRGPRPGLEKGMKRWGGHTGVERGSWPKGMQLEQIGAPPNGPHQPADPQWDKGIPCASIGSLWPGGRSPSGKCG